MYPFCRSYTYISWSDPGPGSASRGMRIVANSGGKPHPVFLTVYTGSVVAAQNSVGAHDPAESVPESCTKFDDACAFRYEMYDAESGSMGALEGSRVFQ